MTSQPSNWPAVQHEELVWQFSDPDYVSARQKATHKGPYLASIPAEIANQAAPTLSNETNILVEEAISDISRFDEEHITDLLPFSALLLRSEAAASSQIENLTSSAKSLSIAEVSNDTSSNAKLIHNNVTAMKAAIALADQLNTQSIINIHCQLLESHNPRIVGQWRNQQVWIGGTNVGPHLAEFVPPHHSRVNHLMEDLVAFMQRTDVSPFVQGALAHAQFETIHPFPDGNGRTGRALIHSLFVANGLITGVCIPFSAGLLSQTDKYFNALTYYRNGNPEPMVKQLAIATSEALINARKLAVNIKKTRDSWVESVKVRKGSTAQKLLTLLIGQPAVTNKTVEEAFGVAPANARSGIQTLVDLGVLQQAKSGKRNRVWIAKDVIAELDAFAARSQKRGLQ